MAVTAGKKKPRQCAVSRMLRDVLGIQFGGGGGNRTPVRRRSAPGATCLVQRSISFRSSTLDKAHRGTSRFCFSRLPTGGNHQRSRDDDPTPTSTSTSGFGA